MQLHLIRPQQALLALQPLSSLCSRETLHTGIPHNRVHDKRDTLPFLPAPLSGDSIIPWATMAAAADIQDTE